MNRLVSKMVYWQRLPIVGVLIELLLKSRGTFLPGTVEVGRGLRLLHAGRGVVIHPRTVIGEHVALFHNVTVGRARPWIREDRGTVEIGDGVIVCCGAVIMVPTEGQVLRIGRGAVVGANAVLTRSAGDYEIWAGNPATKIGVRDKSERYRLA